MSFHKLLDYGKTQAHSTVGATIETLEDEGYFVGRNATACVLDGNERVPALHSCPNCHSPASRRSLEGVSQKVDENLAEPVGIGNDGGLLFAQEKDFNSTAPEHCRIALNYRSEKRLQT